MPLGLMTIRSGAPPAPRTRADTLPEVHATSPEVTRAACSRHTSALAALTASVMAGLLRCSPGLRCGRSRLASLGAVLRQLPGQHPVAQRSEPVQHLVAA